MKILIKAPFNPYSGYGNDGLGMTRALLEMGFDVYLHPTAVTPPLPPQIAALLTKRLEAPFDLMINHVDPGQLGLDQPARRAAKFCVAWTMWEYSTLDNLKARPSHRKRFGTYDAVFAYDTVTAGALEPHLGKNGPKLGVVQGGYWPELWPAMQRDWHSGRFGFAMEGQLHQRKDPFVAIQAFSELKQEHPDEFALAELHLKAQPVDAKVLTPAGWVEIGDLVVGDTICDAHGGTQVVEGVYPQGEQDIYEVEMVGGARTRCTIDHLWLTRTPDTQAYRVTSLHQMRADGLTASNGLRRYRIPLTAPVRGAKAPCRHDAIDPYVLGLLLGDGGLTQKAVHFSSADEELVKALTDYVAQLGCMLVKEPTRSYDYRVVNIVRGGPGQLAGSRAWELGRNPLLEILRSLGLMGLRAQDKHIPPECLFYSAEARLALLRGLMDTDGTVGTSVTFSTTSRALAAGVTALVRSLGGLAACTTPYVGRYKDASGAVHDGSTVYPVRITMDTCPFGLTRKVEAWTALWAKRRHSYENKVGAVRLVGRAEAVCIKVSSPTQIYVTDDYIVTHNTNVTGLHPAMEQTVDRLRIHYDVWPHDVLSEFYRAQHCLLAPSRGEGKNMPALQFMSSGGVVIATNWGGHRQWLSPAYSYPLDYELRPVSPTTPNCLQARASKDHLKHLMLHVFRNRTEAREKGALAASTIPGFCGWRPVMERFFIQLASLIPEAEPLLAASRAAPARAPSYA